MNHQDAINLLKERYMTVSMCLTSDNAKNNNQAIKMAIEALGKQIPKEVGNIVCDGFTYGYCQICKKYLADDETYCHGCGQALKWGD